jgi:UDP-N-acetylmuramate dehydrogenase
MGYGYRTSVLKRGEVKAVVLSAELEFGKATKEEVTVKIEQFSAHRKSDTTARRQHGFHVQEPAGRLRRRLIEAAGLKGARIGNAEISPVHGNFFINHARHKADGRPRPDELAQKTVKEKLGVELELEIELIGEW